MTKKRIRTHTNPFNYYQRMKKVDFGKIFSNYKGKLNLEVGFGKGKFIIEYAKANPDRNIVGIEVRKGIVELVRGKGDIENLYLVHGNAEIYMEDVMEDDTLEKIFIFHPDPWFKKRHHNRRIINDRFLGLVMQKMCLGGKIYISTDVEILWLDIKEQLAKVDGLKMVKNDPFWQKYYKTHWGEFSEKDNRSVYLGCYEKV